MNMKIDLHVHSKFSKRPSQWILQKIGCPESFTEPKKLRDIALRKGMSLVTITDHNSIEGALEIAHLPDTFVSEEVTTYFPDDQCKVHVLVYNITERQHEDIQKVRPNIFDLVPYLRGQGIVHAAAHPLYSTNDRMTLDHFEQILLLFKTLELNGSRDARQNRLLECIVRGLSRRDMEAMGERHRIDPYHDERPWEKNLIGGSDDHSALNIARQYTEVEPAETLQQYLDGIEAGRATVMGKASTPITMAHNLYGIAYQFYKSKFNLDRYVQKDLFLRFLDHSLNGQNGENSMLSRLYFYVQTRKPSKPEDHGGSIQKLLSAEARNLIWNDPELMRILRSGNGQGVEAGRKWFGFVNRISNKVLQNFGDHFLQQLRGANFFKIFGSIGSAGALYSLLAAYFVSFSLFTKDRELNRKIAGKFLSQDDLMAFSPARIHVAHFTDTFYEVNGVALTLQQQVRSARNTGKGLTVITCDHQERAETDGVKNFDPIGVYELPEYPEQKLYYPPFLEMLDYCYEEEFTCIHSATPGPIGLAALAIARILKLPISGTYHTSLPQYARYLTDDPTVEELMWKYVLWYYAQLDFVYVPSKSTGQELIDKGLAPAKVRLFPRGIDIGGFHPKKRDPEFMRGYVDERQFKLLYVGRVSREKDLPLLVSAFKRLSTVRSDLSLVVVGDGPYLKEMMEEMAGTRTVFTGYLSGEPLRKMYASCDLFVFPSATDTFGNVVLEAQASGLPVVVTDEGGPQENLIPGVTGVIIPAHNEEALAAAIDGLAGDRERVMGMKRAAREYMEKRSFEQAFNEAWQMYGQSASGVSETRCAKAHGF
jgi:glycosyltransferase involved in cell wall biosynthesis